MTPLTFVPIGLLEKSQFFDIGNTMDAPKLGVMYKTWQHNFKHGIQKFMRKVGRENPIKNLFFASAGQILRWGTAQRNGKICKEERSRA